MRKLIVIVFLVLIAIVGSAPALYAQFDTATVVGTVRDNTGASCPARP